MSGVIIVGLGPGDGRLVTRQVWELLNTAEELYVRTRQHPAVADLPVGLTVHSFDEVYEHEAHFEDVYATIVARVLELGRRPQGVIYAVPGHPYVAEATTPEIVRRAGQEGLPVRVEAGLSFLEPVFTALQLDPLPGLALVDGLELALRQTPDFAPSQPALIAQIHDRRVASEVKLTLMAVYPDEYPVRLVHAAGTPQEIVEELALYEIDRSPHIGLLTVLFVPPMAAETAFENFQELIARLRAPDGCPWDREQDHQTLRPHLLEEAYEVLAALDADEPAAMAEELGDLLLQIVLHAQIGAEYGEFTMVDIVAGIAQKIVRRHPHVFGDLTLQDTEGVLKTWQKLKAEERAAKGNGDDGPLAGVSLALPALVQAQQYQKRVASLGFDWPEIKGVTAKVCEEAAEIEQASNADELAAEIGDLLFAVASLARWRQVDAESALREANMRFRTRFAHVEQAARQQGRPLE
ncbi:MAG TPA: nucleoside triphosphate pyrophosphohydrolase, partial [Anaerolineales bacterium]|nr:nucleoside triphosphate pyrophosphohydrolase [Anaerolineales bacterium]